MRSVLLLILAAFLMEHCAFASFHIVPGSKLDIVVDPECTQTEMFAAQELQRYLDVVSGQLFPITNAAVQGMFISVGRTAYSQQYLDHFDASLTSKGKDSFCIDISPSRMILCGGNDRGTIYSVYELLEHAGCRWFYPGPLGEVIPPKKTVSFEQGCKDYVPSFFQRSIDIGLHDGLDAEQIIDWCVKNRLNWNFATRNYHVLRYLPPEKSDTLTKRGGYLKYQFICHNFNHMVC